MFVKKLVEKASKKPGGRNSEGLKSSDVDPGIVFHYGIPSGCTKFAYDSIQNILAVSTKDGRIKLFGKDNTQVILESEDVGPSKFLQFIENGGFLLNVTSKNLLEVWDIDKRLLSHIYNFKEAITSFTVLRHSPFMYAGDCLGNVSILKLNQEPCNVVQMKYTIPFAVSHGIQSEVSGYVAVAHALPQPSAESKRVLIIYEDGLTILWDVRESKPFFVGGANALQPMHHEKKKVTAACWACPLGSKVVVGYSTGDILMWSIPSEIGRTELASDASSQSPPICKFNLGYKLDRIPISSLRCVHTDGKSSRLYVMAASDVASSNLLQVVLLNEHSESRTIKLGLQLPEPCLEMEIVSNRRAQTKHKEDSLLVLGKSGHIFAYDDYLIEKYLQQCQSKSSPPLPKELRVKMPFTDSSVTVAKFMENNRCLHNVDSEEYIQLVKKIPSLFSLESYGKDGSQSNLHFGGFSKVKNLYITGHSSGAINFWDLSCPLPLPILTIEQQSGDDFSASGVALTALCFDTKHQILVSGDQNGTVRIYKFKPEAYISGSTKRGNNHIIDSVKILKVNGPVVTIEASYSSRHLAVGSSQGYVALVDIEGPNIQFMKQISSDISTAIISLQFGSCSLHGFQKNILVISTMDSSIVALDIENGNIMSNSMVHPKKPSRALFVEIFGSADGQTTSVRGSSTIDNLDMMKGDMVEDSIVKQGLLLLCSEKAVYLYSLPHVVQGVKKVIYKKKFNTLSCRWASTFYTPDAGIVLLFNCGKIEIRSLPELNLVRETNIRGFACPTSNDITMCSSLDGQLVMVNKDQEIIIFSAIQMNMFRLLESLSQVYDRDLVFSADGPAPGHFTHKEKPKGLFISMFKDTKASREKHVSDVEREDPKASIEELSNIFSTVNFPTDTLDVNDGDNEIDTNEDLAEEEDDIDLNIDDIDLGDDEEKPRGQNVFGGINKKMLAGKFQSLKGKLKNVKIKSEKNSTKEEQPQEKIGAVDQIKRKYGFPASADTSTAAKMAENKLHDNLRKLQGINVRTTEMQDTAKSFSSMAKELLRAAEHDKKSS